MSPSLVTERKVLKQEIPSPAYEAAFIKFSETLSSDNSQGAKLAREYLLHWREAELGTPTGDRIRQLEARMQRIEARLSKSGVFQEFTGHLARFAKAEAQTYSADMCGGGRNEQVEKEQNLVLNRIRDLTQAFTRSLTAGMGGIYTAAYALHEAGFRGDTLITALAIAGAESSFNARNVGDRHIAGGSVGLMQIHWRAHKAKVHARGLDREALKDPTINAEFAYEISAGGKNFGPWTTFRKGRHVQYLDNAREAVEKLGLV